MGQPKQFLDVGGQTLVRRAALAAAESGCQPVIVVLGAEAEAVRRELADLRMLVAENPNWRHGMADSLHVGLTALLERCPEVDSALFMVCDQPMVTAGHLRLLVEERCSTGAPIVASAYGDTVGVPALFSRDLFPELLALSGQEGARQVIARHSESVCVVPFPGGELDLDTPGDYERFNRAMWA